MRNIRPGDPRPGRANQVEKTSTAVAARPEEWIYLGMMIFTLAVVVFAISAGFTLVMKIF
jgi:hypothetical protein